MRAKIFSFPFASKKGPVSLENELNEWLEEQANVRVEEIVQLNLEHFAGILIFYSDRSDPPDLRRKSKTITCGQCRRRPAIEGMKVCAECREYQKNYREKQKKEKKKNRYP